MKAIYFCDPMGDCEKECNEIVRYLKDNNITLDVEAQDVPKWLNEKQKFDILFFDYGGMRMGNSMLECFCEEIIKDAENHPSRIYVMCSQFTKEAMREAKDYFSVELCNIFLSIDDAIESIKDLTGIR